MYVTKQIQNRFIRKKNETHQRSILRQMMTTMDKLENSFLSKQQSKGLDYRQKQEKQTSRGTSTKQSRRERFSHDPFKPSKEELPQDRIYVKQPRQTKQIKDLKDKMYPKISKANIERKFKQLKYIRNMGYKTKNKRLESFKCLTRDQDQENVINKSWENFYQDKLNVNQLQASGEGRRGLMNKHASYLQAPVQQARSLTKKPTSYLQAPVQQARSLTKKPSYYLRKSKFSSMDSFKQCFRNVNLNTDFAMRSKLQTQANSCEVSLVDCMSSIQNTQFMDTTVTSPTSTPQHPRPVRISNRNKAMFKDMIRSVSRTKHTQSTQNTNQTQRNQHLLGSDRNKQITQKIGLNKQKLQEQQAFQLYSLIKGGYNLDRNDVQGEYISLRRFKQAKQNFKMLNTCFKKVRQYRYVVQQPQKVFNDQSFRSLVYLSQIQNKLPPSLLRKVQQLNKVVS